MVDRLRTGLWVAALLRHCGTRGIAATLARRGDADAGSVLVKLNLLGPGFRVLARVQGADGRPGWLAGTGDVPVAEADADAYVRRALDRDYDLWVVEIEDREGRTPFDEPLVT